MVEGVEQYRELYQRYIQAFRRLEQLKHECQAANAKNLHDADVPAGLSIDYFGDGEIKKPEDCAPVPGAV